jgi:starch phosphorylase
VYGCAGKDVPIGSITNGVHARTWIDPDAEAFWRKEINLRLDRHTPTMDGWEKAVGVDRSRFWALRSRLRARLVHFIRERLARQAMRRGEGSAGVNAAMQAFCPDTLTIGFARRFATYKRAPLIFHDPARLKTLLNDPRRPVQLVFAGKAHPRDVPGQEYAQRIHEMCKEDGFRGKVALIEEYDMEVGRMLTAGSDVWLNNPLRPYEASGTSGMKPPMHGGINCSILDGWWPESFDGRNGWAIGDTLPMQDRDAQDRKDAGSLYSIIEGEMRSEFYGRDAAGLPQAWIDRALHSAATVPPMFNTHRMLAEYLREAYIPAHRGGL